MALYSRKNRKNKRRTRGGNRPIIIGYHGLPAYKNPSEDRISEPIITRDNTILAVFDGHGGQETVERVYVELPKRVKEAIGNIQDPSIVSEILIKEFEKLDRELDRFVAGSTGTVVVILSKHIVVANVGDTPALLFTKEGILLETTINHDCYNIDEEKRIIKNGGVCISDLSGHRRLRSGLAVTRSFGDLLHNKKIVIGSPQTYIWQRKADTIISICSDSFNEDIVIDLKGKYRIESTLKSEDIMNELLIALKATNFNVIEAAKFAVEKRVERLHQRGDNTSLLLAYL